MFREGLLWDYSTFYFPVGIATLYPKSLKSGPITLLERVTVALLLLQLYLPRSLSFYMFVFYKSLYLLLGYALKLQSKKKSITRFLESLGMGQKLASPPSDWILFWRQQVTLYVERDTEIEYDYLSMPIEYNAWILFRQISNVVMANAMCAYVLFAVHHYDPQPDMYWRNVMHLVGGVIFLLFNLWVRLDIVRTLDDFSCYWGDFFFLVPDKKSFDGGVLESIPHPMYSVGYIGYYGITLITQSHLVFAASLVSHLMDIIFLFWVEKPHTRKIYEPQKLVNDQTFLKEMHTYYSNDMVLLYNVDPFRPNDVLTLFIVLYTVASAIFIGPSDTYYKTLFYTIQPVFWRVLHTWVGGLILYLQSQDLFWTKIFIKRGLTLKDAFEAWKTFFNLTHTMTFVSFFISAIRFYSFPPSFTGEVLVLRHILGIMFMIVHIWIAISVYQVLGPHGWFHGDFFIESLRSRHSPNYSGIYRYIDHPILYILSCWGAALICSSWILLFITLFGVLSHWIVVQFVEQPHFDRIYGPDMQIYARSQKSRLHSRPETPSETDSGVHSPVLVRKRSVRQTLAKVVKELEEIAKPHVTAIVQNTKRQVAQLANAATLEDTLPRDELPLDLYSLKFVKGFQGKPEFRLGEPIVIEFTASRETMKRKDWIGLYGVHQNFDPDLTTSKCDWKWSYVAGRSKIISSTSGMVNPWKKSSDGYLFGKTPVTIEHSENDPGLRIVTGRLVFEREQLPWQIGAFEARYHYDGKYVVLARSEQFQITLELDPIVVPVRDSMTEQFLVKEIKPYVSRCLEMDDLDPHQSMLDTVQVPSLLIDEGVTIDSSRSKTVQESDLQAHCICCSALV
ncbi:phospholipid methyltransferase-domain-containing protein [Gorgonomyces haynaldii]|nr:phospholipid methyltransferase-domain-containing protein [Gorgonomyces haynaldii]